PPSVRRCEQPWAGEARRVGGKAMPAVRGLRGQQSASCAMPIIMNPVRAHNRLILLNLILQSEIQNQMILECVESLVSPDRIKRTLESDNFCHRAGHCNITFGVGHYTRCSG